MKDFFDTLCQLSRSVASTAVGRTLHAALLTGACASPCAAAQGDAAQGVGVMELVSVLGGLALVLVVFAGMVWAMKRAQSLKGVSAQNLEIVGGLTFGMRDRVVLVKADRRHVLLAVGSQGIRALSEWDAGEGGSEFGDALGDSRARLSGTAR